MVFQSLNTSSDCFDLPELFYGFTYWLQHDRVKKRLRRFEVEQIFVWRQETSLALLPCKIECGKFSYFLDGRWVVVKGFHYLIHPQAEGGRREIADQPDPILFLLRVSKQET